MSDDSSQKTDPSARDGDWRQDLGAFLSQREEKRVEAKRPEMSRFIDDVVLPAFADIADELKRHGRQVLIRNSATSAALIASHDGDEELTYRVQGRTFPNGVVPYAEVRFRERKGLRLIRVESMFRSGTPDYTLQDVTRDEIIRNFLEHYKRRIRKD